MRPCRPMAAAMAASAGRRVRHVERDGVGLAARRPNRVDRSLRVVATGGRHDEGATRRQTQSRSPGRYPRDAPVTKATRPLRDHSLISLAVSSQLSALELAPDGAQQGLETGRIFNARHRHAAIDLLHQPSQHVSGPQLDEGSRPVCHQTLDDVLPAHRRRHLANQRVHRVRRGRLRFGVHVGHDRNRAAAESAAREAIGASRSSAGFIRAQ